MYCLKTDFFNDYGKYLDNYYELASVLPQLAEENPLFKEIKQVLLLAFISIYLLHTYVQNFEKELRKTTRLDLQSYLVLPVQR